MKKFCQGAEKLARCLKTWRQLKEGRPTAERVRANFDIRSPHFNFLAANFQSWNQVRRVLSQRFEVRAKAGKSGSAPKILMSSSTRSSHFQKPVATVSRNSAKSEKSAPIRNSSAEGLANARPLQRGLPQIEKVGAISDELAPIQKCSRQDSNPATPFKKLSSTFARVCANSKTFALFGKVVASSLNISREQKQMMPTSEEVRVNSRNFEPISKLSPRI
jgi:hypothetical protein